MWCSNVSQYDVIRMWCVCVCMCVYVCVGCLSLPIREGVLYMFCVVNFCSPSLFSSICSWISQSVGRWTRTHTHTHTHTHTNHCRMMHHTLPHAYHLFCPSLNFSLSLSSLTYINTHTHTHTHTTHTVCFLHCCVIGRVGRWYHRYEQYVCVCVCVCVCMCDLYSSTHTHTHTHTHTYTHTHTHTQTATLRCTRTSLFSPVSVSICWQSCLVYSAMCMCVCVCVRVCVCVYVCVLCGVKWCIAHTSTYTYRYGVKKCCAETMQAHTHTYNICTHINTNTLQHTETHDKATQHIHTSHTTH